MLRFSQHDFEGAENTVQVRALLQTFHQIQIGQHAVIAEDTCLRVWREQDRSDVFDASWIRGHELAPERAIAGLQIEAIDESRQFAGLVNVERAAVGAEGDGLLPGIHSSDHTRLTARHGIQISLLIRANSGDPLRIGRDDKRDSVHALLGNSVALARGDIEHVKLHTFARFISGEKNALSVGEEMRPAMVDVVIRQIPGFAGSGRQ